MHETAAKSGDRFSDYRLLREQAEALWERSLPLYSNLANVSALVKEFLDRTNWAGFYLWEPSANELVLGPFQGLVACTRIAFGKGVCGAAVKERRTQLVADVHQFPGHITCDGASESEIVVPLIRDGIPGEVLGVLDVDSPVTARFDAVDQAGLEDLARALVSLWK
ncbi:MAG TPA: GAF domain-containing protein [Spirochaetia bacterium]|nr:GAF domain-containing protein [Spirochaetia bacterium]